MTDLRLFGRDERGVTVVEFAVLAPVLIFLIMGSIELGHIVMVKSQLEGAVGAAARAATADLTTADDDRDIKMRASIDRQMSIYPKEDGRQLVITTKVFRTFGSSYPESFEDTNDNGRWDPATGTDPAEPFDDRNRNGVRDVAQQVAGKLGGPGDVVLYEATFPAAFYFGIFRDWFAAPNGVSLSASTIMRNEPVARAVRAGGS